MGAVAGIVPRPGTYYIEAGQIHYPLWRELRQRLPPGYPLNLRFLMSDAVHDMGYQDHLYGPGDLLTLLYRFHPDRRSSREDLLAARSLIYNKLIAKEEIASSTDPYPHTRDELEVGTVIRKLTLKDCRRLFYLIRRAPTDTSRDTVFHYLDPKRPD